MATNIAVELQRLVTILEAQGYTITKASIEGQLINLVIRKEPKEDRTQSDENNE